MRSKRSWVEVQIKPLHFHLRFSHGQATAHCRLQLFFTTACSCSSLPLSSPSSLPHTSSCLFILFMCVIFFLIIVFLLRLSCSLSQSTFSTNVQSTFSLMCILPPLHCLLVSLSIIPVRLFLLFDRKHWETDIRITAFLGRSRKLSNLTGMQEKVTVLRFNTRTVCFVVVQLGKVFLVIRV